MSENLGFRVISTQEDYESISNATRTLIDEEIRSIADAAYERAEGILKKYRTEHLRLANALMKYETLDGEEVDAVIKGKPLVKRLDNARVDSKSGVLKDGNLEGHLS